MRRGGGEEGRKCKTFCRGEIWAKRMVRGELRGKIERHTKSDKFRMAKSETHRDSRHEAMAVVKADGEIST